MMFVYVLKSEIDGRLYVGMTINLANRIREHNLGRTKSTKGYRPWSLIHQEEYPDRITARNREKYLKSGYGKQWLKNKYKTVPYPPTCGMAGGAQLVTCLPGGNGRQGASKR
ncbi:MAG: GIY-YIG nuclease family protein [Flavobacteriaceae bacterium]|nr:GIY-YIG nuclease family protein [Bacteroidia bacterium]NNK87073.1 GIY-YIG nuclease family protein [Flavobacteriaceae bacterium]